MQLNSTIQRIILIVALICSVAGYNLWPYAWHGFFYHCNAIFIFLLMLLLKDLSNSDFKLHKVAAIGFWLSVNNLLDELFFDPKKIQWNEYLFAVIIIFLTLRKKKGNAR